MWADILVGTQQVRFDDSGSGSPVLLIHSSGLSSQQWRRLRNHLIPHHRVLAPDLIGYGQSARWSGPGEFQYGADLAVVEAIAATTTEPIHIVGHSYGGFLALRLAEGGQAPVASVSLFDPVAFGVLHSAQNQEGLEDLAAVDPDGTFFAPELAGTEEWCQRFVDYWGGAGYWSRLPSVQRAAFLTAGVKMFLEVRSIMEDRTPHQTYAAIKAPTLLMTGSLTPPAGRHVVEVLSRTLPHAHVEILEGAGHMGPMTHSEAVNALISGHIDRADNGALATR